jgi:hypothetical protein
MNHYREKRYNNDDDDFTLFIIAQLFKRSRAMITW